MNLIIEIYMFVCIMLLIFNIAFLVSKNFKTRKFYPKNEETNRMIKKEFEEYDLEIGISYEMKDFLKNKLGKTKKIMILQKELEKDYRYMEEIRSEIKPYILNQIEVYEKKTDYEQAYYAYIVSCFNYKKEKLEEKFYLKFLSFLDSKSLYVFANAMDAIYQFSDPYIMLSAIKKIDERDGFYHSKLLVDGLLDFKGDIDILHPLLIEKFYKYSASTQEGLLNYFRLKNIAIEEFCLEIIEERKVEAEVLYSAMRYFVKQANDKAKNLFMELLKDDETFWVEQLIAIKGLNHYDEPLVRQRIKEKITSENWHLRTNAIIYLHNHGLSREEISNILSLEDKYTNETLIYYYKDNEEISKYIRITLEEMCIKQNKKVYCDASLIMGV